MGKNEEKRKRFDEILAKYDEQWDEAKKALSAVLKEGIDKNDIYLIAAANYWLGVVCFRSGERSEPLPYAMKAVSFFAESDDHEMKARSYNLLAAFYTISEEYLLANEAFKKAYDILLEHPEGTLKISGILNNFASNYARMGDMEKAIEYAEMCLEAITEDDPAYYRIRFMSGENLSWYYETTGNFEKAISCTDLMRQVMEQWKKLPVHENCYYCRLASISFSAGDTESGMEYVNRLIELKFPDVGENEAQHDYERIIMALVRLKEFVKAGIVMGALERYAERSGVISDLLILYRCRIAFSSATGDVEGELQSLRALRECFERKNRDVLETERLIQTKMNEALEEVKRLLNTVKENEKDAVTDGLTGFYNKTGAERFVGEYCTKGNGMLLILDLDSFKLVNDLYGHQAGDEVLKAFAGILKKRCMEKDLLCRIGGDEFLACITNEMEEDSVISLAGYLNKHILKACQGLLGIDFNVPIGVSVGAVEIPAEGSDYPALFKKADRALYKVKQNGKHGAALYREETESEDEDDIAPEAELRQMMTIFEERGTPHEALTVGSDAFSWIYRFVARFSLRHETNTMVCMLKLKKEPGVNLTYFSEAVYAFEICLREVLRRNDVILIGKNNTMFLMLSDLPKENTTAFINRLTREWNKTGYRSAISISWFFRTVGERG